MENIHTYITKDNIEIICYTDTENKKWFDANIICKFLEYDDIKKVLKLQHIAKYVIKCNKLFNSKLKADTKMISEAGLYRLILNSTQKDALQIQEWLAEDVMPQLQKNKIYKLNNKDIQKFIK